MVSGRGAALIVPTRPTPPCSQPGCPGFGHGGCEQHKVSTGRVNYAERGSLTDRSYPQDWARRRLRVLRRDPVCKACGRRFSTEADHIVPLERGGSNDEENLQGLDKTCHSRKTVFEQREHDPAKVMALVREAAAEDRGPIVRVVSQ